MKLISWCNVISKENYFQVNRFQIIHQKLFRGSVQQVLVFKRKLMVWIFVLWNVKLLLLLLFSMSLRVHFFQQHSFKHTHLWNFLRRATIEGGQTLKLNCILKHYLMYSSGSKKLIKKVILSNQVTEIMCFSVPSN